jgi:hypothetical protein
MAAPAKLVKTELTICLLSCSAQLAGLLSCSGALPCALRSPSRVKRMCISPFTGRQTRTPHRTCGVLARGEASLILPPSSYPPRQDFTRPMTVRINSTIKYTALIHLSASTVCLLFSSATTRLVFFILFLCFIVAPIPFFNNCCHHNGYSFCVLFLFSRRNHSSMSHSPAFITTNTFQCRQSSPFLPISIRSVSF